MKIKFLIFFFVTFNLYSQLCYDKDYKFIKSKHFEVIYHSDLKKAKRIIQIAENIHSILASKFYIGDNIKTFIILIDNYDIANGMATLLPNNIIILYDTAIEHLSEFELLNFYDHLEELILHEYVHILHLNQNYKIYGFLKSIGFRYIAFNAILPISSIEGLAVSMETYYTPMGRARSSFKDMILRTAVYEDKIPKIDEITTFLNKIPYGFGPYIWGGTFHYYLLNKYSEEKILKIYNFYGTGCGCLVAPFYSKFFNSLVSFLTLSPLNSIFEKYTKKSYYQLYSEWRDYISKEYKNEISNINNPTILDSLIKENYFWSIFDLEYYNEKIYFSGFSPHLGYAIYCYDIKLKKFNILIPDVFATSITIYKNNLYFVYYDYFQNNYFYAKVGKFNIKKNKFETAEKILNSNRIIYIKNLGNYLIFVKNNEIKKEVFISDLEKFLKKIIELDKYDVIGDFVIVNDELFFILKKDREFFDIYKLNFSDNKIERITKNPGIEISLFGYNNELYFIGDYENRFNIYRYNLKEKSIEKLTDFISGLTRFIIAKDKFYLAYYKSEGFVLSELDFKNLKSIKYEIPIEYKNFSSAQTNLFNKEIELKLKTGNFSHFNNMFKNFLTFPELYLSDNIKLFGLTILFEDIFSKNNLLLSFYYENNNYFQFMTEYLKRWNKFQFDLYLNFDNESYLNIAPSFALYKNKFKYYWQISFGYSFYKIENIYNFIFASFYYKNYFEYLYSVVPEKGFEIYSQYSKRINSDNFDLFNFKLTKYQRSFLKHNVFIFDFSSGWTLNKTSENIFLIGYNNLKKIFFYKQFTAGYSYYEKSYKNYLLFNFSYNFPIFWIERGIMTMPILLKNIWLKTYYEAGNGFNNILKLEFLRLVGIETHISFILFYNVPIETIFGFSYELDERRNKNIYFKIPMVSF